MLIDYIDHIPYIVGAIVKAHANGLCTGLNKGFELARKYPDAECVQDAIKIMEEKL